MQAGEALVEQGVGGATVTLGDALGETALHRAAACADIFLWKQLLTLGGDVNLPNDGGYTPIQKALRAGNTVALGVMRECGAYTVSY